MAPRAAASVVARARLDDSYQHATGQVVRLLAPGGYGKSTQIARWVERESRQVCWLDLERIDNEPYVLATAMARALKAVHGDANESWIPPFINAQTTDILADFRDLLHDLDQPVVLVLDDVHHVHDEGSLALIDALVGNLPAESTLILSGRSHPGEGSFARHRLHPGLIDITTDELALDLTETSELLESMGIDLEPDALAELSDRFEGWPAGIRLAGLVLRADGTTTWLAPARAGDASYVIDYLRTEWTGQLPPDDLVFLRELACLERFSAEMCDGVLGRAGSMNELRRLHRNELLVLPLDRRDEWFRMHSVLAGWLSADLRDTDVERWREIHSSASAWWAGRGDIDLAVDHAFATEAWDVAEELVATHGGQYLSRGMYSTVRRWLDRFSNEYTRASPPLCVVHAHEALSRGESARSLEWSQQLERALASQLRLVPPTDPVWRRSKVLRMMFSPEPASKLIVLAADVGAGQKSDAWDAWALHALGGLQFLTADPSAAETFAAAAFVAELNDLPAHQANCVASGAILAELDGDRARSTEGARRAWAILSGSRAEHSPTTAHVDAVHALAEGHAGNRDVARQHVDTALAKLAGLQTVCPWYNVLGGLAIAKAALLVDDRRTSRAVLAEIDHHLRLEPEDNGATRHVEAFRAMIGAARLLPSGPASQLTEAELKVLAFLPTNLPMSDIATRLYLSRNTVKSHVAAIYRKLGATSRTEAVDVARRAGVLDGPPEGPVR